MRVGLIDVDAFYRKEPKFPNLALMRISSWHKAHGDEVEWWWTDFIHYDVVYMSKVFSDAYSPDVPEPANADRVIRGGTGYAIWLQDGKEVFDPARHNVLPPEMERMFPDYSIYPQFDFAVSMTSRGCPRGCAFCHVAAKEGRCSTKVADVKDFWNGQKLIKVLDPNITACREKRDLMRQYLETGAVIDFTQGIDIRLVDEDDIRDLNAMKLENVHFAWDNAKDRLEDKFRMYAEKARHHPHGAWGSVYVLTNYNSTLEEDLYRINTLRELGYDPYVMIYNKPSAPKVIRHLQRWCNNKIILRQMPRFDDYLRMKTEKEEKKT